MTLGDANKHLLEVDCYDPEAVASALNDRARAIAEFAVSAPKDLLEETLAAGALFRERLESAQTEARLELDRMLSLSRGLQATLNESQPDQVTCFG